MQGTGKAHPYVRSYYRVGAALAAARPSRWDGQGDDRKGRPYANMVCLPRIPEGKYPVFSHTKKEGIDEHSLFTS